MVHANKLNDKEGQLIFRLPLTKALSRVHCHIDTFFSVRISMKQKLLLVLLGLLFLHLGPLCHVASAQTSSVTIDNPKDGQTVSGNRLLIHATYTIAPGYQTGGGSSGTIHWLVGDKVIQAYFAYISNVTGSGQVGGYCDTTIIPNGVYTVRIVMPCNNAPTTLTHPSQYIQSPPITVYVQN